ncbi:MAG: outer membrane beta-barrel protein [Bacteroidia bacterium]
MKRVVIYFAIFWGFSAQTFAQSAFGGTFSFDYNIFQTIKSTNLDTLKSAAQAFSPLKSGGLSIGVPVNIKITSWFLLRPQAVFNIALGELKTQLTSGEIKNVKISTINVEFPIQLLLSNFKKPMGLAFLTGIRGGYQVKDLQKNSTPSADWFKLNKTYANADFGLGFRFGKKKTIFIPEIRYSMGISNLVGNNAENILNTAISDLRRNRFSFVLNIL